jgi:hypothetical protein
MIVDLPRLRARNSPRLIASYKVVRPEREAEQASLIVNAIGVIWFDILRLVAIGRDGPGNFARVHAGVFRDVTAGSAQ